MTNKRKPVSTHKRCRADSCPQTEYGQKACKAFYDNRADSACMGYEAVLWINLSKQEVSVLHQRSARVVNALNASDGLHREMLLSCTNGKICHYEWSMQDKEALFFYQTSLVPLCDEKGHIGQVFSVTRNITSWAVSSKENIMLREGGPAKTFAQMLLAAREEEKKNICKTLHDELGSSAVMLGALLRVAQLSVEKGACKQALCDLEQLSQQLQASLERMKNVIVSLRPPSLEQDGALGGCLRELLENVSHYLRISFKFDYSPRLSERGISDNVKILLYRVVQEALNNIAKHARAKYIAASLKKKKNMLYLTISDDGIGFSPEEQRSISHIGLLAMKDSVHLLGGNIRIKSAPGKGTEIEVSCPCVVYEESL